MTRAEAVAILGPEVCARIRKRLGPPKPLTREQIDLLVNLFDFPLTEPDVATDADATHS